MRHEVDVAGRVVGDWQFGCLGKESDRFAIGRDIVVTLIAVGLHRGLWSRDGSIDSGKKVLHLAVEGIPIVSGRKHTAEDRRSLSSDVREPVANEATSIDLAGATRHSGELWVVGRAVIAVCKGIDDKVDCSGLALDGLEAGIWGIQRSNKLPTNSQTSARVCMLLNSRGEFPSEVAGIEGDTTRDFVIGAVDIQNTCVGWAEPDDFRGLGADRRSGDVTAWNVQQLPSRLRLVGRPVVGR